MSTAGTQAAVGLNRIGERRAGQRSWEAWNAVERIAAAAALTALSPLLLGAAVAIRLLSGRPPLVALERVGRGGRTFRMLKVRSMWPTPGRKRGLVEFVETNGLPNPKQPDDPRVTSRLAKLIRRYSIDELPQLFHVVSGRMALVGPRPMARAELDVHYGPDAAEVLSIRPGLTGLWQIRGRSRLTYRQRRRLDLFLVRRRSVRLYLKILLRTVPVVLSGSDAW